MVNTVSSFTSRNLSAQESVASTEQLSDNLDNLIKGFDRTVDHIITTTNDNVFYHKVELEHSPRNPLPTQLNELSMMRVQVQMLQGEYTQAANLLTSVDRQISQVELSYRHAMTEMQHRTSQLNLHTERSRVLNSSPGTYVFGEIPRFRLREEPEIRLEFGEERSPREWLFDEQDEASDERRGSPLRMMELRLHASDEELDGDEERM